MVGVHVPQTASRSERQTFRSLLTFRRFWGLNSGPWVCVANTLPASRLASHPVDFFKVCIVFNYICFLSLSLSFCVCVCMCTYMHMHACVCSLPVYVCGGQRTTYRSWSSFPLSGSEGWIQIARPYGKRLYSMSTPPALQKTLKPAKSYETNRECSVFPWYYVMCNNLAEEKQIIW